MVRASASVCLLCLSRFAPWRSPWPGWGRGYRKGCLLTMLVTLQNVLCFSYWCHTLEVGGVTLDTDVCKGYPWGHHLLCFHSRAPISGSLPTQQIPFLFRVTVVILTGYLLCPQKSRLYTHWAPGICLTIAFPVVRRAHTQCLGGEPCQWVWRPLHSWTIGSMPLE